MGRTGATDQTRRQLRPHQVKYVMQPLRAAASLSVDHQIDGTPGSDVYPALMLDIDNARPE